MRRQPQRSVLPTCLLTLLNEDLARAADAVTEQEDMPCAMGAQLSTIESQRLRSWRFLKQEELALALAKHKLQGHRRRPRLITLNEVLERQ